MNAVIYARYSSDNQREESIEGQLRECKEYADQNGITVVRTYIDRALSAKTDSRPQFQQMIHDSATHTFEAVLVWKLDRFSRNRYDSAHYKRILKNNRVHVVSVTEPISNTPEGIMLESLLEGMAEYYSAELAEKVSRGHKENALKAKFNGGPVPLGYRIDSEHHYQIDPTTAPVVQEAFQRYAAGESIRGIIESLNARGIRNSRGNPFTKNSFQTLLKNRRYLGEYRYKDTVIPDAIPAIIDPDCFDAVQRRCEIHRQAPAHNKADVHYLLTTKLFCGKCGTMMAGESGRSHTGTVHCYYKCGTRKRSGKEACSLKPVRKEPLEQFVVQTALEKVLNDRVIDLLADKLLEYQSKENTRLPVLQAELNEVKRRIDNLVAAIEQGILTPSTKARMEELEQQREALETSILQEQIEKPPITREQILFWFDQFRHGDPADIAFQEKVIDCFVNSIYLFDDRIVVNFNYQEGGRPVSLAEVLGSFLDGNGAPQKTATNVAVFFIDYRRKIKIFVLYDKELEQMELRIKEIYSNLHIDENAKAILVGMLQGILEGQQLDTLDYFVVVETESGEFEKAVSKYAAIVGTEANVTRDVSYHAEGKTLSGLGIDGRLHQVIIITSAIFRKAIMEVALMLGYLNIDEKTIHEEQLEQLYGVHLIVHEIGHAVDYENRYRMFGTVNTKTFYNLGNERERQEYFLENAFSLWGEYYAEAFSFKNFNKTPNQNEGNLRWCIDSYFDDQVNFYLERAYRILYFFVLTMAYEHEKLDHKEHMNFDRFGEDKTLVEYLPYFVQVEEEIYKLYQDYPYWSSTNDLDGLMKAFNMLIQHEYEKQRKLR